MSGAGMPQVLTWGESVARQLVDAARCPRCGADAVAGGCCRGCGADLRGPIATEVWNASVAAAAALRERDALLTRLPLATSDGSTPAPAPAPAPAAATSIVPPAVPAAHRTPQGSATLQSVLATAGAGLFAVAAIVFTYLNPDLADRALRSVIVGVITLVFLGGAWLLSRRGLRFSAEAVGGLGLVFGGLDVHAVAQLFAPSIDPWLTSAVATAGAGAVMLRAGAVRGIRVWQWTAQLALSVVPAMLAAVVGTPLSAALGAIGVAFAATGLVESVRPPLTERVTLTVVQVIAALSALVLVLPAGGAWSAGSLLTMSALLLLVSVHAVIAARRMLSALWAYGAGGTGAAAIVMAACAPVATASDLSWLFAIIPASAALALVLVGAVVPLPPRVPRGLVAAGAFTVLAMPLLLLLVLSASTGISALARFVHEYRGVGMLSGAQGWACVVGLATSAIGLALFATLARGREDIARGSVPAARLSLVVASVAVLVIACADLLPVTGGIAVAVIGATAVALVFRVRPSIVSATGVRVILRIGAYLALVCAVMVAWREPGLVPLAGVATVLALAALAAVQPARFRFLSVGAGFAYTLVIVATALGEGGVSGIPQLCLTASAGLAVAIVTTYLPRVGARAWQAVLAVATVPFGIGVLQVVVERSGWTALSTGLMFVLAVSLLFTRRPGLTLAVRTAAAAMPVPALAVVIVCLGAQLLATSGSPVVLPLIAVVVALALSSTGIVRGELRRRGHSARVAGAAVVAIEASALLTGAIAVGLALWRDAAGVGTAFLVLLILGIGASSSALLAGRAHAWWAAGASFTGALWCLWSIAGVDVLEAYLLPPTLGAALVAVVITLRGRRATALFATGLAVAICPLLAILCVVEPDGASGTSVAWRVGGLLVAAWMLLGLSALIGRPRAGARVRRLRVLRVPLLLAGGLASTAGTIAAVRIGLGWDLSGAHGAGLFLACLGVSAVAAAVLALAGDGIRRAVPAGSALRRSRWLGAPAVLALAGGTWFAIERDWFSIWSLWTVMLALLIAVVVSARGAVRGDTALPPVWFLFAVAFVTAVVAWSPRDLRVEWFSLPLGAFLLLAGMLGLRAAGAEPGERRATLDSWPGRWRGSWALLAPGLVTMLSASIVSTFTDPLTWRAILVMVLALIAILAGSARRSAAPFLVGIIVLPIENVFVFAVQIGRGIASMPWWITLAVVGAVLLIIAVTAERRAGEGGSVAARLRDLR